MEGPFVLSTHICGKALYKMAEKTDKEIVTECVKVLEKLFPEEVSSGSSHLLSLSVDSYLARCILGNLLKINVFHKLTQYSRICFVRIAIIMNILSSNLHLS